jgi:hypothetical protein
MIHCYSVCWHTRRPLCGRPMRTMPFRPVFASLSLSPAPLRNRVGNGARPFWKRKAIRAAAEEIREWMSKRRVRRAMGGTITKRAVWRKVVGHATYPPSPISALSSIGSRPRDTFASSNWAIGRRGGRPRGLAELLPGAHDPGFGGVSGHPGAPIPGNSPDFGDFDGVAAKGVSKSGFSLDGIPNRAS